MLGKDPQPAHHGATTCDTTSDNGGVHINSGIPNHAFYLAAVALGGNAWEQAGHIWYDDADRRRPARGRDLRGVRAADRRDRGPALRRGGAEGGRRGVDRGGAGDVVTVRRVVVTRSGGFAGISPDRGGDRSRGGGAADGGDPRPADLPPGRARDDFVYEFVIVTTATTDRLELTGSQLPAALRPRSERCSSAPDLARFSAARSRIGRQEA